MGIGVSVFLMAVGAILTFAIDAEVEGVDLSTVGIILMIAGALGLLVTLVMFGNARSGRSVVSEQIVDEVPRRTVRRDEL